MKLIIKTIGYTISIILFIAAIISLYYTIKPHTITKNDIYWATYFNQTIEEYLFENMIYGIIIFIVLIFLSIALILFIQHKEKKIKV